MALLRMGNNSNTRGVGENSGNKASIWIAQSIQTTFSTGYNVLKLHRRKI